MDDLIQWLEREDGGIYTYISFHDRCRKLSAKEPEQSALYTLLGALAARFADEYDEKPLPVEITDSAATDLLQVVKLAREAARSSDSAQLRFLNNMAELRLARRLTVR
jgi:hypothetical protein